MVITASVVLGARVPAEAVPVTEREVRVAGPAASGLPPYVAYIRPVTAKPLPAPAEPADDPPGVLFVSPGNST